MTKLEMSTERKEVEGGERGKVAGREECDGRKDGYDELRAAEEAK